MKVYTTAPMEDPRDARTQFTRLEEIGYDGAFSFEAKHDPFLPLACSPPSTRLALWSSGTAIAIAFARNPMNLANLELGASGDSRRRTLRGSGLGSQVRPHIEKRFSIGVVETRQRRMREIILADPGDLGHAGRGQAPLDFRGRVLSQHTLMIPAFDPGPNPFGQASGLYAAGFGPLMTEVAGEVADGFIAHPFTIPASRLIANTLPALERGLAKSGRQVVQGSDDPWSAIHDRGHRRYRGGAVADPSKVGARKHLAFYGSTPAYAAHPRVSRLGRAASGRSTACPSRGSGTTWQT